MFSEVLAAVRTSKTSRLTMRKVISNCGRVFSMSYSEESNENSVSWFE